jgi:23S rRNA (pseudouridine1915-N3)-methyltransferase
MKVRVVALGHRMPAWVTTGFHEYTRRLPRDWAFQTIELRPEPRNRGRGLTGLLAAEATRIAAACIGHRIVALDERGAAWTTPEFAARLSRWQRDGDDVAFVIGSADGLAPSVKSAAAVVVALSAMTLPHGLARIVLAEQLYRAYSVMTGHPYHRD